MPAAQAATFDLHSPTKEDTLATIKAEVARQGITPDELATVFEDGDHEGEGAEAGPKSRKKKAADATA